MHTPSGADDDGRRSFCSLNRCCTQYTALRWLRSAREDLWTPSTSLSMSAISHLPAHVIYALGQAVSYLFQS